MSISLNELNKLIEAAISEGVFPGCQVAFGTADDLWVGHYGALRYASVAPKVSDATLYDLASLTKVVATTLSAVTWVEAGVASLDELVCDTLPSFRQGSRAKVTLRHLLTHTSGLPAHRDFYKILGGAEARWDAILNEPLETEPGAKVTYSCVGFLVMQKFFEAKFGERDFFKPLLDISSLKMLDLKFISDVKADVSLLTEESFAPTELVENQEICGVVHDENSRSLGGKCANAGLFGNSHSVANIARMWLKKDIPGVNPAAIANWTTKQVGAETRALGWDTKSPSGSSAGSLFGPKSFGHTGFTGTSLWIDPEAGFFAVLLTNRVFPTRENTKIIEFRPKFHDAVYKILSSTER